MTKSLAYANGTGLISRSRDGRLAAMMTVRLMRALLDHVRRVTGHPPPHGRNTPCLRSNRAAMRERRRDESIEHLARAEAALLTLPLFTPRCPLANRINNLSYADIARITGESVERIEREMARSSLIALPRRHRTATAAMMGIAVLKRARGPKEASSCDVRC